MGIQELERTNQIHNLSCQDLEDIVGKFESITFQSNFAQIRDLLILHKLSFFICIISLKRGISSK